MRARLLAGISLLLLILIPINLIKLVMVQPPVLDLRFVGNGIIAMAAVLSLVLLFRGRLLAAGNTLVLICLISTHFLIFFFGSPREPLAGSITLAGLNEFWLLLAIVFGSKRVAVFTFVFTIVSLLGLHFAFFHDETVIPGSLHFAADTLVRDGLLISLLIFAVFMTLSVLVETAHHRSEQSLRTVQETNANLERLVSERTLELEAATARANEASHAKSEFLADMSHEIRTPLHAIIATAELLQHQEGLTHQAADQARIIADSGDLLLRQIDDVLDLSKIESGQVELENAAFQLQEVIRNCDSLMRSKAQAEGVTLEYSVDESLPSTVVGDSFRLRQIFLNLISNAVKFTPSGGRVSVSASQIEQSDGAVSLAFQVKDTGIGMDEATMERLFQRFTQADASTSRKHGGTGLGLAICRQLVELMGGTLEAESSPGQGSTFHFKLAFPVTDSAPPPQKQRRSESQSFGLSVLVADDNAVNRKIITQQLARLGCTTHVTGDGEELLAALDRQSLPDLVLIDCDMPKLNGLAATRKLRSWASDPNATECQRVAAGLPVVALTAAASPDDEASCRDAGMDDFLSKPVKLDHLQRVLDHVAARRARS